MQRLRALPDLSWLRRLGIAGKLNAGFGALAVTALLVAALGFFAGKRATEEIARTEAARVPMALASAKAEANLLQMQLHLRGYLVLGDSGDVERYEAYREAFEASLADLGALSARHNDPEASNRIAELRRIYAQWVDLPLRLFELHDNPLQNRPALRFARIDVQPRQVQILSELDAMITAQRAREPTLQNRELLADLVRFQTSFDVMVANLTAYAASGELNFKLVYGPQLATNAVSWRTLTAKRELMNDDQQRRLRVIGRRRAEIADLALRIINVMTGERAYEDLHLYRTQVVPRAQVIRNLLAKVTTRQQVKLQAELARARAHLTAARLFTGIGGMVALGIGIAMALWFREQIVGPVRRLTEVAERVTGGDLSSRAPVESTDEIGRLAMTLNTMTQRLAENIRHLEAVFVDAQHARATAEIANRAKSAFLANMSHELRTPLNAILGYTQILRRDQRLSSGQAVGLNTIQQSGEHLLMLINDVLDLSKVEAGKLELYRNAVDVPAFLSVIADIMRIRVQQKSLIFHYEFSPDLPRAVQLDEKRLRQVLLNLLGNAVKFTDRGQIWFRVRAQANDGRDARLRFEVQDTGMGILPEHAETIFRPFEQVGDAQRRGGGAGLGLPISRQLVRLMGGDIHVQSEVGQGSMFWFELNVPILEPSFLQLPLERLPSGYRGPRKKLLVVDDVPENRAVLVDLLMPIGFEMCEAEDGRAALERVQALRPDLIVMDTVMPGMDGLTATSRLRAMPGFEKTPIIAASASVSETDKEKTLAAGANTFLPKPIAFEKLLEELSRLLRLTWIYQPAEERADAGTASTPKRAGAAAQIDKATLASLPPELAAQLERALLHLDIEAVRDTLAAVRNHDVRLADGLGSLAADYQYDRILRLLRRGRGTIGEEKQA